MSVSKIDGELFKKMVLNGAINLKNNHSEIDQLNVFPVPDGDTGTNMQMTVMSGVREMESCESSSICDIAKALSRGALMGARGNSGVILSQYFRGVYQGIKEASDNVLSISDFINCLECGYKIAYKAVMNPVEGTILTVVREAAETVVANCSKFKTIEAVLDAYVKQARITLEHTPDLLPVLKEAGVVDSGGAGFIKIVEGMILALKGRILESIDNNVEEQSGAERLGEVDIKYGYCTEFIIDLKNKDAFQESDLKAPLSLMGDSLVLVQDENLVKVHVHTNTPGEALNTAQKYGEFVKIKVENMRLQHSELINKAEDVKTKERKKYAIIAVCFGEGIKNTFKELGVDYVIEGGQTMNPSTEAFVNAIEEVNADNVIILPNNGNVIMAAEQAIGLCPTSNVRVLKAKTVAQGYASLMAFDQTTDLDTNCSEMTNAINNVKSGEITYSIRDTEINGIKICANDYMGISDGEIVVSTKERVDATHELLRKRIDSDSEIVTIFYGCDVSSDEAKELVDFCQSLNEDLEVELIDGSQEIYSYIIAIE